MITQLEPVLNRSPGFQFNRKSKKCVIFKILADSFFPPLNEISTFSNGSHLNRRVDLS